MRNPLDEINVNPVQMQAKGGRTGEEQRRDECKRVRPLGPAKLAACCPVRRGHGGGVREGKG